MKIVQDK